MNATINRALGDKRSGDQVSGQRRITVPSRIEGSLVEKIDGLVKGVAFIDVIDVRETGSDRAESEARPPAPARSARESTRSVYSTPFILIQR